MQFFQWVDRVQKETRRVTSPGTPPNIYENPNAFSKFALKFNLDKIVAIEPNKFFFKSRVMLLK